MAYNGIQQNLYNKTTKKILASGHIDFASSSEFNSETQDVVELEYEYEYDIHMVDYEYDDQTTTIAPSGTISRKFKTDIITEIIDSAEEEVQLPRILNAFDKYPTIIQALDICDYTLTMDRVQKALDASDIIQDDYNLIDSKVPPC